MWLAINFYNSSITFLLFDFLANFCILKNFVFVLVLKIFKNNSRQWHFLTFSARRLASRACCSQTNARSKALSFSSFIACIFFLIASMVIGFLVYFSTHKKILNKQKYNRKLLRVFVYIYNNNNWYLKKWMVEISM